MAFQVLGDTVIDQNQIITSPKLILEGTSSSESILSGSLNGSSKLEIKADGSATFSGEIISNGITQYTLPTIRNGGQLGYDDGTKSLRLYSNSSINANAKVQFHFNQSGTSDITFNQGGSATFGDRAATGDWSINPSNGIRYNSGSAEEIILGTDGSATLASGGCEINSAGRIKLSRSTGTNKDGNPVLEVFNEAGTKTVEVIQNGSTTFKGRVDIEGSYLNVQRATSGQGILQGGYTGGSASNVLILANGSATFTGTVDAGALTIGGSSVDTSAQVDAKIAAIPVTDLSNYDTSTEVTNKINTLLGGAPAALDTLNELAAAIGDDANFASTITGQLSTINTQLSGKADSSSLSNYLRLDQDNTITKSGIFTLSNTDSDWAFKFHNSSGTNNTVYMNHPTHGMHIRNDSSTTNSYLFDVYAANGNRFQVRGADAYTTINGNAVWHAGNDGSGSGLDADKLDGQEGSYYRNASNINAGTFPDRFSSSTRYNIGYIDGAGANSYDKLRVWDSSHYTIGMHSGQSFGWLNDYAMTFQMNNDGDRGFVWRHSDMSSSQGAMSLTTGGNLCVKNVVSVGGQTSRYLTEPTGNYGSIQIAGSGHGGWEGFSVDGRAVFMHNGDAATGIYNDVNNHWLFYAIHNGSSYMYHAGNECIKTVSSTDATIGGDYIVRTAGAGLSKSGSTINIDFSSLSSI